MQARFTNMFARVFETHLGEEIEYNLPSGEVCTFDAIVRRGVEFFDETGGVVDRQDVVTIFKKHVASPQNGDTFVYSDDGRQYRIGTRLIETGAYTQSVMANR